MDYSRYNFVKVEKEGKVAIVTMNRPEVLNAIRNVDHTELEDVFADISSDNEAILCQFELWFLVIPISESFGFLPVKSNDK